MSGGNDQNYTSHQLTQMQSLTNMQTKSGDNSHGEMDEQVNLESTYSSKTNEESQREVHVHDKSNPANEVVEERASKKSDLDIPVGSSSKLSKEDMHMLLSNTMIGPNGVLILP